jgi:hypothetical protein
MKGHAITCDCQTCTKRVLDLCVRKLLRSIEDATTYRVSEGAVRCIVQPQARLAGHFALKLLSR